MFGLALRIVSTFTGNIMNTLVIIGLFGAFYASQNQSGLQNSFNKEAAFDRINSVIEGASSGSGSRQKVAQKTSSPKMIRIK